MRARALRAPREGAPAPGNEAPASVRQASRQALVYLRGRDADGRLLALCAERARARPLLATLAEAVVRGRAYEALGFRCLGDWSRERIGVGARAVREYARVWRALRELPRLREAVVAAEVSWTVARKVVGITTPENEASCLETVRGRTVRAVETLLAAVKPEEEDASEDREERVRVRIECAAQVTARWEAALELARRMAGEELPVWQAAEAIAAEGAAALGSPDLGPLREERHGSSKSALVEDRAPGLRATRWPKLRWRTWSPGGGLEQLAAGLDEARPRELDRRIRQVTGFLQRVDFELGRILRQVLERRLYRELGFERFETYVVERLDLSPRTARRLVRLARAEHSAPEVAIAFRQGRITLLQAEALLRGAGRVEDAERLTLRKLQERAPRRVEFWAPRDVARLFQAMVARVGLEALLDHAVATWLTAGRQFHDYADFERDGFLCTVPGCTARRNLHSHHICFRSAGGADEPWNRTTLCAWHHQQGVHAGRIGIRGRAPDGLVFQLGVGRFRSGDVRVSSSAGGTAGSSRSGPEATDPDGRRPGGVRTAFG